MKKRDWDDVTKAVFALDIFKKNWCMNCEETEKRNEPIFRCSECCFENHETGICSINKFVRTQEHGYPMDEFGSML